MLEIAIIASIGTPYLAVIPPVVATYLIFKRKIPIALNPLNIGLILLFFLAVYSGIVNKSVYSILASVGIILFLSCNIYIQHYFQDENSVEDFLCKVWKYSLIAGILGIIEKMASYFVDMTWISELFYKGPYIPTVENYRIYSTFGNPNIAGAWFAAMVLLSLYLFEAKSKRKPIYMLSIFIFIVALIATGSRGATLGLEIGILVYALFNKSRNTRIILICTFVMILILAMLSPEINHSISSRDKIWEQSIDLFMQKPVTGWGVFGILDNIKKTHAHNIWISFLAMFGAGGLLLYSWMKYYIFKSIRLLYCNHVKSVALLASIQALIIGHGVVDFVIMAPQGGILFFATSSIIIGLSRQYELTPYPSWHGQELLDTRRY